MSGKRVMPSSRKPDLPSLVGASAVALLMFATGGAHAQSRPAGSPDAVRPPAAPQAAPRDIPTHAACRGHVVESRPGGCPEGPPCRDEAVKPDASAAPGECAKDAKCSEEE